MNFLRSIPGLNRTSAAVMSAAAVAAASTDPTSEVPVSSAAAAAAGSTESLSISEKLASAALMIHPAQAQVERALFPSLSEMANFIRFRFLEHRRNIDALIQECFQDLIRMHLMCVSESVQFQFTHSDEDSTLKALQQILNSEHSTSIHKLKKLHNFISYLTDNLQTDLERIQQLPPISECLAQIKSLHDNLPALEEWTRYIAYRTQRLPHSLEGQTYNCIRALLPTALIRIAIEEDAIFLAPEQIQRSLCPVDCFLPNLVKVGNNDITSQLCSYHSINHIIVCLLSELQNQIPENFQEFICPQMRSLPHCIEAYFELPSEEQQDKSIVKKYLRKLYGQHSLLMILPFLTFNRFSPAVRQEHMLLQPVYKQSANNPLNVQSDRRYGTEHEIRWNSTFCGFDIYTRKANHICFRRGVNNEMIASYTMCYKVSLSCTQTRDNEAEFALTNFQIHPDASEEAVLTLFKALKDLPLTPSH